MSHMTRSTHIRNGPFPVANKTPERTSSTVHSRQAIDWKSVIELSIDFHSILLQLIWKEKVNDLNSLKTIGSIQLDKQANAEVSTLNIEPKPCGDHSSRFFGVCSIMPSIRSNINVRSTRTNPKNFNERTLN